MQALVAQQFSFAHVQLNSARWAQSAHHRDGAMQACMLQLEYALTVYLEEIFANPLAGVKRHLDTQLVTLKRQEGSDESKDFRYQQWLLLYSDSQSWVNQILVALASIGRRHCRQALIATSQSQILSHWQDWSVGDLERILDVAESLIDEQRQHACEH